MPIHAACFALCLVFSPFLSVSLLVSASFSSAQEELPPLEPEEEELDKVPPQSAVSHPPYMGQIFFSIFEDLSSLFICAAWWSMYDLVF